jgi:hypothetical protein
MNNWAGHGWPLRTWWTGKFMRFHTKRLTDIGLLILNRPEQDSSSKTDWIEFLLFFSSMFRFGMEVVLPGVLGVYAMSLVFKAGNILKPFIN